MDEKIFALYDKQSIRVYQAYNDVIADEALKNGQFGESFRLNRMTWIKPSFLWMMYRSGWGTKENQNRVLAIDMSRLGFDYIVRNAVLSSFNAEIYETYKQWKEMLGKTDIRCQWDPDRDIYGNPLKRRTIQLGVKGETLKSYTSNWILHITDITQKVKKLKDVIMSKTYITDMLPFETEYIVK